jgi:Zn-dependent protease with chaperone function
MRIIVKGFKDQSIVTIDQLLAMVEKIPLHHKQKIKNIVYDPSRFFQKSYVNPKPLNTNVAAQYNTMPWAFIVIYRFDTVKQLEHMLYHEIGHHVYNHVISSTQKKQWVTQIYPQKRFISDYAATNASEDFAETYAFYFHDNFL